MMGQPAGPSEQSHGRPGLRETPTKLRSALLTAANPHGGLGYYPGKSGRVEPTSWALLALAGLPAATDWDRPSHLTFLARCQRSDGLLVEEQQLSPNIAFNGLAALALLSQSATTTTCERLLASLVRSKGVRLPNSTAFRQDSSLQGWSWIDRTFSWVEPTCWCLLALKKWMRNGSNLVPHPDGRTRIDEAEQLLFDRCCRAGGWNYGNSNVLGQELRPYIPTTALGLLALQDRRKHPAVARSLDYLVQHRLTEKSGMALALTLICFRVYGLPFQDLEDHLLDQSSHTSFLSSSHITAMALYSLTGDQDGAAAFRV